MEGALERSTCAPDKCASGRTKFRDTEQKS